MTTSPVTTQWIDIPLGDGVDYQGYLALPPAGTGPGILLIQEIFGVNHHIRAIAEQYAMDGYVVLAPDVFWKQEPRVELGYEGADMEKAFSLMQAADFPQSLTDLAAAAEALRQRPECNGTIASIGYCMGGILSYLCATQGSVDRAVSFYPGGIARHLDKADNLNVPVQFHLGAEDHLIPPDQIEQVKSAFASRPESEVHVYDAGHGFNCWARGAYVRHAAALSRGRVLTFLEREYLLKG
ncbi:MAG: dienelactone hydrolase family protein [Ectothiorhodospiraceae bacterium]|nr:dienelactone hydrolase family protein [Ectothiorhodospiraceae bacterium]MCH8503992.1 dienelactone hydrolase family protein [Ectothiorhodospiraceae bacterium]